MSKFTLLTLFLSMQAAPVFALNDSVVWSALAKQEGQEASDVADTQRMLTLALPEQLDLKTFIDYVAAELSINIQYSDQVAALKVRLETPEQIERDSLLAILEQVLASQSQRYALQENTETGVWNVVAAQQLGPLATPVTEAELALMRQQDIVMHVFQLEHITAANRAIDGIRTH